MTIKTAILPEKNENVMFSLEAKYLQPADACSGSNDYNELTLRIEDGGDGFYFVIETDRWAFDDPKELMEVLNDFIVKLGTND